MDVKIRNRQLDMSSRFDAHVKFHLCGRAERAKTHREHTLTSS